MAFVKKPKQEEKQEPDKRQPEFLVRARQSPDSEYWVTIGAAWPAAFKDGKTGYSVKINTVPVNWDGDCLLMSPLESKD